MKIHILENKIIITCFNDNKNNYNNNKRGSEKTTLPIEVLITNSDHSRRHRTIQSR